MHKKLIIIIVTIILLLCAALNSCQNSSQNQNPPSVTSTSPYEAQIKELEEQILALRKNQTLSDAESQAQIAELEALIDQLRSESTRTTAQPTTQTPSTPSPRSVFIYTLEDGKATITGFTGDDEHIVIPARIDGFDVYGISANAFEDYQIKSVIISEGVEIIDWFAFYRCSYLESVTIPTSVRRIGHSAFEGCSTRFTIYCHDGSFAQSYAQSYGIPYAII